MQLIVDPLSLKGKFPDASPSRLKHVWLIAVVVSYSPCSGLVLRTVSNLPNRVTFSVEVDNIISQRDDLEMGTIVNLEAYYNGSLDELIATNFWVCETPTVLNNLESLQVLQEYANLESL